MSADLYHTELVACAREAYGEGRLAAATTSITVDNPLCGDRVTVYLAVEGDRIADVSFEGRGCAISTAAASLMTEVLKGKSIEDAKKMFAQFHARVTGGDAGPLPEKLEEDSERLEPLTGVRAYPARVKCATLPWHAFEAALKSGLAGDTVKTE